MRLLQGCVVRELVTVWNRHFLRVDETLLQNREFGEVYDRLFAPPSKDNSSAALFDKSDIAYYNEEGSRVLLLQQLKPCANNSSCCSRVEGEFKRCSKCRRRRVWYCCSVVCQGVDWKRHKRTDCVPLPTSA